MINLTETNYKNLARLLIKAIGDKEYFNGHVEYDTENFHCTLVTTLVIWRSEPLRPRFFRWRCRKPDSLVPVWWECRTTDISGTVANDFSWRELMDYIPLTQNT